MIFNAILFLALNVLFFVSCKDTDFEGESASKRKVSQDLVEDLEGGDDPETGANTPAEPTEVEIFAAKSVKELCEGIDQQSLELTFEIPASGAVCEWRGLNSNKVSGVKRFTDSKELPEGSVICEIGFTILTSSYRYDDQFILLMNDYALAASYFHESHYEKDDGLNKWSDDIWQKPFSETDYKPWCYGQDTGGSCSIPKSDKTQAFSLQVGNEDIQKITQKIRDDKQLAFTLAMLGGDEKHADCAQSGLTIIADLKYVQR